MFLLSGHLCIPTHRCISEVVSCVINEGHSRLLFPQRLKDRVPTKCSWSPRRDDGTRRPSLEDNGLGPGPSRVCEGADSIGCLVVEANEKLVEAIVSEVGHEVFDVHARKAVQGVERECSIFSNARTSDLKNLR